MHRSRYFRRVAALTAIAAVALLAFAGGLMLMNIRADWTLALGALIGIAAPLAGWAAIAATLDDKAPPSPPHVLFARREDKQ